MKRVSMLIAACCAAACADETEPLEVHANDGGVVARDAATGGADAAEMIADSGVVIAPDSGLLQVGEACVADQQCESADSPCASSLYPPPCLTDWPNGYCIDDCTLPPGALDGPSLLRADCPAGAVCVPRRENDERPDIGTCLRECTVDDQCRTDEPNPGFGYYCRRNFQPLAPNSEAYINGYCAPPHCMSRGCARSFVCEC